MGRRISVFTLGFAFALFVGGGFYSGYIFLNNWKDLFTRGPMSVPVQVPIPAGPRISVPIPTNLQIPPLSLPPMPAVPEIRAPVILPDWQGGERINVILLGIDQRDDERVEFSRADTVLIVSVDPVSKSAVMISMPRDLWVSIPGYGAERINVAHVYGGPALLQRTVEANFGLKAPYYARINFRGFEQMVDTMGGVIVDVERPIKDDEYPTEDYGYQRIYIPPGPQLMDGKVALQFARSRHSENDFGRARRQQRLLVAMRDRGLQLNMLPKVPALVGQVQQTVTTNLSATELLALAKLASEIDREKITNLVIDTEYADAFIGDGGANLLRPRLPQIRRVLQEMLPAPAANGRQDVAKGMRVEILNGTTRPGLAARTGELITQQGFQVVRVDTADRTNYEETVILTFNSRTQAGDAVATALKLPPSAVRAGSGQSTVDVRIILGRNYQLP